MLDDLKIAIVCDWLTDFAGAERVILQMHELFPRAPIYTSLYDKKKCKAFAKATVHESFLAKIPFARKMHRLLFPLMPRAFESFDLDEYDIVLSSSHAASKGVITRPETLHISYCHSPTRYLWDHSHEYQKNFKKFSPFQFLYTPVLHRIRLWDRAASERVDHFIANSNYIAKRISKYYRRDAEVIHPPVDLNQFKPGKDKQDYFLAIGRLIPYKRFDLAVQAANKMGFKLKIVGNGPELNALKKMAGETVEFLGHVSADELLQAYQGAKALIFPQLEDFGIVPLEAMACGTPVIAYGEGGATETVVDGKTGLFFRSQTVESLTEAIERFNKKAWDHEKIAEHVDRFTSGKFKSHLRHSMSEAWKAHLEMIS